MYDTRGKSSDEIRSIVSEGQADLSHDPSQKYYVAHGFLGLGYYLWWNFDRHEALQALSTAKEMFEALECPVSTAECLFRMASCYAADGDYSKALPRIREALVEAEQLGEGDLTCRILLVTARCLIGLAHYEEAVVISERNILLCQALGRPLAIVQTLELLGYICAAKMDLPRVRLAYEGARVQFVKIKSFQGRRDAKRCADNLEKLGCMTEMNQLGFLELTEPNLRVVWSCL
jgi:tetratricopeptide (TPR) repeat protein